MSLIGCSTPGKPAMPAFRRSPGQDCSVPLSRDLLDELLTTTGCRQFRCEATPDWYPPNPAKQGQGAAAAQLCQEKRQIALSSEPPTRYLMAPSPHRAIRDARQ